MLAMSHSATTEMSIFSIRSCWRIFFRKSSNTQLVYTKAHRPVCNRNESYHNEPMEFSGLSSATAREYLAQYGYNEIIEKKDSLLKRIAQKSFTFISGMLLLAALLSLSSGKLFDFFFILALLCINIGVTLWQEQKADHAIEELNVHLATSVRTLRDGVWHLVPSRELVPGDYVELRTGNIMPADLRVVEATNARANEAALTGESLPKDKVAGDPLYSGSFISAGLITAQVTTTGNRTTFGKTITTVDTHSKVSSLQKDILRISRFLSLLSLGAVLLLTGVLLARHASPLEVLRLDLSLVIAGIPISLPTVMTLIIAFGTISLAKKQVIVRRLASLQELANADFLLTDKTGTLTQNHIAVDSVVAYGSHTSDEVLRLAALLAQQEPETDINAAILQKAPEKALGNPSARGTYVPGDSSRKRTTLTLPEGDGAMTLSLGAPQIIESLCTLNETERAALYRDVDTFATRGYRTLALSRAIGKEEAGMTLVGILSVSDQLRSDAPASIRFLKENGVGIAMVTGDNRAIAQEVATKLDIPGSRILTRAELSHGVETLTKDAFEQTRAFAEILPEDKYALVMQAKKFYTVAANGDGINDLPAVRAADVGFAVANAVDALKSAADIVLLEGGIAVMKDAFIEGRKIFARLYGYSPAHTHSHPYNSLCSRFSTTYR